jgi:hypothetical protein
MKLSLIPILLSCAFTAQASASSTKHFVRSAAKVMGESETPEGHRQLTSQTASGLFHYSVSNVESNPEIVPSAIRSVGAADTGEDRQLTEVQGQVTKLQLINADTDKVIVDLEDTMVIALDAVPNMTSPSFNILALVNGTDIRSVRFGYNGNPSYRTETVAPYAFCGNDKSNYYSCDKLGVGNHTVTVTPRNRNGKAGRSVTVKFTIVESDVTPPKLLNLVALTPTTVNVTAKDAIIVLQVTVQDDASGMDWGIFGTQRGTGWFLNDLTFLYSFDPKEPLFPEPSIGVTNNDVITFNLTMRIRRYLPPGVYQLFCNLVDQMLNHFYIEGADLMKKGFVSNFTLINSIVDTTEPSLLDLKATSPLTVNATDKDAMINFNITVQDDLSGIDFGGIQVYKYNETSGEYFGTNVEFGKGGTNLPDGSGFINHGPELPAGVPHTFKVSLPVTRERMPPGQYKIYLNVIDGAKNIGEFGQVKLPARGFPSNVTIYW